MLKTKNAPQSKVQGDKVLDAETLLKAAAKGTAGKSAAKSPFDYDGDLQAVASKILSLERQQAEIEREIALAKDELRSAVDPWFRERVKHNGYESSVRVPGTEGTLRISYIHRYTKLPASKAGPLAEIVGEAYDDYFKSCASLKVRKEIADEPEKLHELVLELASALGERFVEVFEAEQTIVPTRAFTERRWSDLTHDQNEQLDSLGVKQIVSIAEHKGK